MYKLLVEIFKMAHNQAAVCFVGKSLASTIQYTNVDHIYTYPIIIIDVDVSSHFNKVLYCVVMVFFSCNM